MITTRDKILSAVMKPTRYTGGELNSVIKNPADVDVRFGFCFADTYEIAMSHLGLKILYHTLNDREDTYCERVFAPWTDMEEEMKAAYHLNPSDKIDDLTRKIETIRTFMDIIQ